MAQRKPRVEYKWRARTAPDAAVTWEVTWSLYGANGEYMCGSGAEGYRDKTDARRALNACAVALTGDDLDWCFQTKDPAFLAFREVGPGRKPARSAT